jgi:hypothetical protein
MLLEEEPDMRVIYTGFLASALAMGALPATAQQYYQGYQSRQWSHADEHRAHEAFHEAERQAEHARRDAAVGDYHGAAHARERAHEAYDESVRHGGYQQRSYDTQFYGQDGGHTHDGDH